MATPFYLEGTQTAGLFSQPQGTQSTAPYTPGQGQAPYGESSIPSLQQGTMSQLEEAIQHANQIGETGGKWDPGVRWNSRLNKYVPIDVNQASMEDPADRGAMSIYEGYQGSQTAPQQQDEGFLTIGEQTPEEIARNEAIMNAPIDRTTSGGGGGGGSVQVPSEQSGAFPSRGSQTESRTGLNLSGVQAPQNTSPQFNPNVSQYPDNPAFGYQAPPGQLGAPQGGGQLQMQQASPQQALDQYAQTPGYQLLFGGQPDFSQPAAQRFQKSPGYDYAVGEAMDQVQEHASARGLLESGSALRGMTDRAQGMALQEYDNWWNRQNQQFSNYQNRLAGLAGGPTGAEQAYNRGQTQGAGTMQMGDNMGSLFANQGSAGFGGMINTGAAQAGAMNRAGTQQAQVNAANQSTTLSGAIAGQQNQGLF